MQSPQVPTLGYVVVKIRSRPPRLWGWHLRRDGSDDIMKRSKVAYGCAEDAWEAGRRALAKLEAAETRSRAASREEASAA